MDNTIDNVIRVTAHSRPRIVAGAIAGLMREERQATVQAIGAHAVNQAIKSIIVARDYLESDALDLFLIPSFEHTQTDNSRRILVRFTVYAKSR